MARGSFKVVGHAIVPSLINTDATLGGRGGYGFISHGHACAGKREHHVVNVGVGITRVSGFRCLTHFPHLLIRSRPRLPYLSRLNQETILRGIKSSV